MIVIKLFVKNLFLSIILISCLQLNAQENVALIHSYNYSKIKDHPRLLLNKGEENALKLAIEKSAEFKKIDTYIRQTSDDILSQDPVFFQKNGKRLLAVSRKALTRLYYLSYSYRMTGDNKYLQRAEKELHAVCDFESWNPDHFLDVGEMCMAVAIAYDWLYDDLQESTKAKVRKTIVEKAFKPSYNEKDAWFLTIHNNWNSVCNAGLVYGALAIFEDEKEQSIAIIERALKSNKLPLQAYAPHGNYPEGPGYWNYGTTFQVMLFAALESALGSDNGLSKAPGFMESGNYMLFMTGPSGYYFNYSDGGRQVEASSSMFWFADKLSNPSLVYQEMNSIRKGVYTNSNPDRILPNTLIFGKNLNLSEIKPPSKKVFTGYGITPVSVVRTAWEGGEEKYLGIKGGNALTSHAHMDQGTFVYDVGNLRWAMDFGLQSYITLENAGVDLWNKEQNSQRWEVFRQNNLNHNTLTINNQRHNVSGNAEIIETFDTKKEAGAKINLKPVLNLSDELKTATRKAVIVENSHLMIEDFVETNNKSVDLRWNMVTPASAKIIDEKTIRLSQKGKVMLLKFSGAVPFKLAIRPSENPKEYKSEFGNYKYGDYNSTNKGTVMIGFDANIPANKAAKFMVTFIEERSELLLPKNTLILDAPNPSSALEGGTVYKDISKIRINGAGFFLAIESPGWSPYGETDNKNLFGKSFNFIINAKRITPAKIVDASIDRTNDGQLGIRGGESNGIDNNEGYLISLDLKDIDPSIKFELTKIAFGFLEVPESCTIVNRQNLGKMMVYKGGDKKNIREVKISANHKRHFVDVSGLGISLKGGEDHFEFLSLFNTSEEGSFRIAGFEFTVKE